MNHAACEPCPGRRYPTRMEPNQRELRQTGAVPQRQLALIGFEAVPAVGAEPLERAEAGLVGHAPAALDPIAEIDVGQAGAAGFGIAAPILDVMIWVDSEAAAFGQCFTLPAIRLSPIRATECVQAA